ncbi:uncharacterized protein LOC133712606 isoform X1 [Rosa rugosa]|uniref:uncharacterized protein LOC133712606 isoform X1 n=2 Tax=Rosa rugosa TaxID=74645 RepID=UPI002B417F29|nr:uncharacterized protein LOC133712606 isoform X1 [Rosa rugosa]XP_061994696.1 uncharacterized protein LOC133712606 isoform X1 [Rosa rugosa]XP_061994697.1 uncharacterized protein LOC133712606 isoform X1 [Rosa rugosa]
MAAENGKRGIKRFLEPSTGDRIDQEKSEYGHVRSKRLKRMFHPEIAGGSNECRNEMQLKGDDENAAEGMAAKDAKKGKKRLSKESTTKRVNQGKTERSHVRSKRLKRMFHPEIAGGSNECRNEMQLKGDDENAAEGITTKDANRGKKRLLKRPIAKRIDEGKTECSHDKSKRLKRMFCREINEKDNQCQSETEFRGNAENSVQDQRSRLFGQASYQQNRQGLTVKYEDSGDNVYSCNHCDACFWLGEAIKRSTSNASIIYTNCCRKGKIKLERSKPTPTFLEHLLNPDNGSESRSFRENIRIYNSMFAFTSMGANIDYKINNGLGPYVFKISGQVHHLMGSLLPSNGESPKYAQLYIYDTKNEVSNRINAIDPNHNNVNIKSNIVEGLIKMFDQNNELVKEFRTIRDRYENGFIPTLNMTILNRQPTDSKQYETPTSEEIGGLIVGDIGQHNANKDLIIESKSGCLQRISKIHPKYMSLQYPILFPYGEDGYKPNLLIEQIPGNSKKKKTTNIYASIHCVSNPRPK